MGSRESRSAVNSAPAVAGAFYCCLRSRGFEQVRKQVAQTAPLLIGAGLKLLP